MKWARALAMAALAVAPAYAADGIKAGKWEFSAEVQMPNMPKLPPGVQLPPGINIGPKGVNVTRTSCVDSSTPMPADMHQSNQQHGQCKVARLDISGGTVRWETTCTQQSDGTSVHSEGVAHYAGNAMEANVKTVVINPGGPSNETTQHLIGHYLGPCDAK